ncbi:hypothetical protein CNMCM5878_005016 [Aspergillus fumigatiaffinis]|nr:hypothetical protein CNMCM5878_005016 [Aspergillus fumigatiaffinis]
MARKHHTCWVCEERGHMGWQCVQGKAAELVIRRRLAVCTDANPSSLGASVEVSVGAVVVASQKSINAFPAASGPRKPARTLENTLRKKNYDDRALEYLELAYDGSREAEAQVRARLDIILGSWGYTTPFWKTIQIKFREKLLRGRLDYALWRAVAAAATPQQLHPLFSPPTFGHRPNIVLPPIDPMHMLLPPRPPIVRDSPRF